MDFRIRDSQRDDFQTLWRIDQECFPPGISYSRLELAVYMRRPGSFTLVAESGPLAGNQPSQRLKSPAETKHPIAGFVVAEADRRGVGHIITIDVVPSARRSGVGSRLLASAEQRLCAAHCASVYLETAVDNTPALSFYKRHHYYLAKTVPRYYSNGVDAFVLRKDLLSPVPAS